ncbi:MAG: tRNA lysidine(34) synthetase TilS [Lachnospiraceae bacterium]|nr:tRNA lysidine(34) synthetase TilS [Lachnospiraceae bacterium]
MDRQLYTFEKTIEQFCRQEELLRPGMKVLAGVSGGADSVCLLLVLQHLAERLGFELAVLHVEHGLRGEESLEDARFVQELSRKLGLACRVCHVDVRGLCRQQHLGEEEAARILRHRALEEAAREQGAQVIALAHHRDDQAETVLMNILRGSGLKGLEGMRPKRGRLIRPLLCVGREQIEAYLLATGQAWRTDGSNLSLDYTRNRIRREILPLLAESVNARAAEHLVALSDQAARTQSYLENEAREKLEELAERADTEAGYPALILPVDALRRMPALLQEQVIRTAIEALDEGQGLKDIGRVHILDICGLVDKGSGKRLDLPGRLKARRQGRKLWLYRDMAAIRTAKAAPV